MKNQGSMPGGMPWVAFRNDSEETIPPYGCMKITGGDLISGQHVLFAEKPDGEFGVHMFNGPREIAYIDSETPTYGMAVVPCGPVWASYDTGDTPANADEWGPVDNSWEIGLDGNGFIIVGDERDGRVLIVQPTSGGARKLGKTSGAISKGASGTIDIYSGTKGSETATGETVADVYNRFNTLASGSWVIIDRIDGAYEIIMADNCSE